MSTIKELRAALERVQEEQKRISDDRLALLLQLEETEREKNRLETQIKVATKVPTTRMVSVPGRRAAS